jgi:hypothetical protein
VRRADWRRPPTDLCQPTSSITASVRNDYVDVSGSKLSQSSLLHRVGRCEGQHSDLGGSCSWGRFEFWHRLCPFKGRGRQPLSEFARIHFHLLVPISTSHYMRILVQGLGHACSALQGVTLPEDAARLEANRTHGERLWIRRRRRRA